MNVLNSGVTGALLMGDRVLVTGSAGVVGSHTIRQLLAQGVGKVIGLDPSGFHPHAPQLSADVPVYPVDIRDQAATIRALREHRIDTVVHLGAALGGWYDKNPIVSFEVNLQGTARLFEAAKIAGVDRVLLASSRALYEGLSTSLLHAAERRVAPRRPYAIAKFAAESLGRRAHHAGEFEFASMRFADFLCSERCRKASARSADLLNKVLIAAILAVPVRIEVDGSYVADVMLGEDLGSLVAGLISCDRLNERAYNIGSGLGVELDQIVKDLQERYPDAQIDYHRTRWQVDQTRVLDVNRLQRQLKRVARPWPDMLHPFECDIRDAVEQGVVPSRSGPWLTQGDALRLQDESTLAKR